MTKIHKVLMVNSVNFGSTGTIMLQISKAASINGYKTYVSYPPSRSNYHKKVNNKVSIGNRVGRNLHLKLAYYTGWNGCYSKYETKQFLKKVSEIKPDIIHLHNLHNCYINIEMLFAYIKSNNIPIVWTLHDCWAFTGQCPHYTIAKCNKWKTGCQDCPQYKEYPPARVDRTKEMYELKRKWFTGVKNMTIVTPSEWLKNQVEESFLSNYPVNIINNGIDLSVFRPTKNNFRKKYGLVDKTILLGVASPWSTKKGLDIFVGLAKLLGPLYKIVLVGLSNEQINALPGNILGLPRTDNQIELAKIYTAADYFINPSLEETMGLVTVEALACGTPVIVSNSTAVPEVVSKKCGLIVENCDSKSFFEAIINIEKRYALEDCVEQAKKYDMQKKYKKYIDLYGKVLEK